MPRVMKSPRHCWRAASDAGDSWLQLTIPFYVLLAIPSKTHVKQDIAPPSLYKQRKFQVMMSDVLHQCGKRVLSPTFVLSFLLLGILSKAMQVFLSCRTGSPAAKDLNVEEVPHLLLLCWTALTAHGLAYFLYPEQFCTHQGDFHLYFGKLYQFLLLCTCVLA